MVRNVWSGKVKIRNSAAAGGTTLLWGGSTDPCDFWQILFLCLYNLYLIDNLVLCLYDWPSWSKFKHPICTYSIKFYVLIYCAALCQWMDQENGVIPITEPLPTLISSVKRERWVLSSPRTGSYPWQYGHLPWIHWVYNFFGCCFKSPLNM